MRPDQDSKQERDEGIDQHPAGIHPAADVEIKNKLENSFDHEKRCQHQGEPGETGERTEKEHEPGRAVNDREQQLPEKTADAAARSKPKEQMPDTGGEQDPADYDRNTNPGDERQSDCQKPAYQHQDPPDHIAFAARGS